MLESWSAGVLQSDCLISPLLHDSSFLSILPVNRSPVKAFMPKSHRSEGQEISLNPPQADYSHLLSGPMETPA